MHLQLDNIDTPYTIKAIEKSPFRLQINDMWYTESLLLFPHYLNSTWGIKNLSAITQSIVDDIQHKQPDIFLLGMVNADLTKLDPTWRIAFNQAHIGLEIMSLDAASRTYTILLSEGRHAGLGLVF